MSTFTNNEQKLTYAENAIDALRMTVESLQQKLFDTMTVRDQFAAAALSAIIRNHGVQTPKVAAEVAYQVADEMMKARAALGEGKDD